MCLSSGRGVSHSVATRVEGEDSKARWQRIADGVPGRSLKECGGQGLTKINLYTCSLVADVGLTSLAKGCPGLTDFFLTFVLVPQFPF